MSVHLLKLSLWSFSSLLLVSVVNNPSYANNKSPEKSHAATQESYKQAGIMSLEECAKELQTLAQYEIDESFILRQAQDKVTNQELKAKLLSFEADCENNIRTLSELIRKTGREAPSHSRDFKGFFMQGYVGMRGLFSDTGVLQALSTNGQIVSRTYENVLKLNFPADVKEEIRKIYEGKKKYKEYLASQLEAKASTTPPQS